MTIRFSVVIKKILGAGCLILGKYKPNMYYLNSAPFIYYGLKPPMFKGRFAISILTIAVLCLRVEMTPTAL